jgi:hypothetical protein
MVFDPGEVILLPVPVEKELVGVVVAVYRHRRPSISGLER